MFTLVDTASAELHNRASSPSQQNTEGLLTGSKNENLSAIGSTDETQIIRPPVTIKDEAIQNDEETSKNLSILKDGVDDKIFTGETEQYVVRAEPKVVESKGEDNIEKKDEKIEVIVQTKEPEAASVTNASSKDAEAGKNANQGRTTSSEGTEHVEGAEDIPSFSEWAQKQLAEAEKKKGEFT